MNPPDPDTHPSYIYVTRFALTQGIIKCEVIRSTQLGSVVHWKDGCNGSAYFSNKDYKSNLNDAIAMAESMRARKTKTLALQLERMKALKVAVVECRNAQVQP